MNGPTNSEGQPSSLPVVKASHSALESPMPTHSPSLVPTAPTAESTQFQPTSSTVPVQNSSLPIIAQITRTESSSNPNPAPKVDRKLKRSLLPFSKPTITDGRYENFAYDQLEKYPRGYPSVAAFISADIDGRVYRRFSYVRNRLLLWYQDQIVYLESQLNELDEEDLKKGNNGEAEARQRLISRRYDEKYSETRSKLLSDLEAIINKYDNTLLREHEIMSIRKVPAKIHKALFDFIWNGKEDTDGQRRKHLLKSEYEYLFRQDDFMILGNQEDAWLGSFAESVKSLLPRRIRDAVLASAEDRKKSASTKNVSFYSNERVGAFVKGIVCAANTALLVVPVVILYAMSIGQASGWLKIAVLLIFVVIFAFLLAALTNASRSEMFGASAGYCAVLIVFLTYTGP